MVANFPTTKKENSSSITNFKRRATEHSQHDSANHPIKTEIERYMGSWPSNQRALNHTRDSRPGTLKRAERNAEHPYTLAPLPVVPSSVYMLTQQQHRRVRL